MNRKEIEKKITDLERKLQTVQDIKRKTFLMATINRYSRDLGKPAKYNW